MDYCKCDKCGAELVVGSWPYCKGDPADHSKVTRFGEEPMGPTFFEHLGTDGMEFRTRGELRRYMDKNGLEPANTSHMKPKMIFS